jgi:hypothetical protein
MKYGLLVNPRSKGDHLSALEIGSSRFVLAVSVVDAGVHGPGSG